MEHRLRSWNAHASRIIRDRFGFEYPAHTPRLGVNQSSGHFDGSHRVILSTLSLVFDAATPILCRL